MTFWNLFRQRDTLERYVGRTVLVRTNQQSHPNAPYVGKVVDYDGDFVRLNPVIELRPARSEFDREPHEDNSQIQGAYEDCEQFKAGTSNAEKLLNRNVVASIEVVVDNPKSSVSRGCKPWMVERDVAKK